MSSPTEVVEEGGIPHANKLARIVSKIDEVDATERYAVDGADNKIPQETRRMDDSPPPRKIVSWGEGDPENPYNWSASRKAFVVIVGTVIVLNSTIGSALTSNAIPYISLEFNITSTPVQILPQSMYLIGYIFGPLVFGPLSETYGRKMLMIITFGIFVIFTMACALAPNFAGLLVFRLIVGVNASSPITVTGGIYADLYNDPVSRGRAMTIFMAATCVGPLVAPVISGFVSPALGWRWSFWIALIIAGVSYIPLLFLSETYGPILLARRARALRKKTGNDNIFACIELEKKGFKQMATVTLTRPIRMLFFEPIVSATCAYLALCYGIFYMYFQAYPVIFEGIYKMSPGIAGLMFLPIFIGVFAAATSFMYYDTYYRNAKLRGEAWTEREEARRVPLACVGGPFFVVALFWLGWTARESIPWCVPMLAGIPWGVGFALVFMSLLNYIADAYEIFAASAMAANSCSRSIAGAALPFAATPMYRNLGVAWASTLLAFLSLGMCVIPFVFMWKGDVLRANSEFCIQLRKNKEIEMEQLARERSEMRRYEDTVNEKALNGQSTLA